MSCLNEDMAIASEGLQNLEIRLVYLVIEQGGVFIVLHLL